MESVNQVKQALSARSRTATLEELASQGRKQVRLIKAEHVAAMITAAVNTVIEESGLIPKDQADSLVERSREEFKAVLQEREQELARLADLETKLREREDEIHRMQQDLDEAHRALEEREASASEMDAPATAGTQLTPEQLAAQQAAFQQLAAQQFAFQQLAAQQAGQQVGPSAATGSTAGSQPPQDFTAALEKLAGSLNDRLEKLGQKMGISSAVEGAEVDFDGLFRHSGPDLESNMDNIQVKKKAGGGIAANLERLKKLKGGG
jgi:chromosome segregation ATPase